MKSLQESIISSTNVGKGRVKENVEKWLTDHFIYNYTLDEKDYSINLNGDKLYLDFKDYTELPSYIKFNGFDGHVLVHASQGGNKFVKITSLRGLPEKASCLTIYTEYSQLSDLNIELRCRHDNDYTIKILTREYKPIIFENSCINLKGYSNRVCVNNIFGGDISIKGPVEEIFVPLKPYDRMGFVDDELNRIKIEHVGSKVSKKSSDEVDDFINKYFGVFKTKNYLKRITLYTHNIVRTNYNCWEVNYFGRGK